MRPAGLKANAVVKYVGARLIAPQAGRIAGPYSKLPCGSYPLRRDRVLLARRLIRPASSIRR